VELSSPDLGLDMRAYNTRDYGKLYETFEWDLPETFNIGTALCDAHLRSDPDKIAVLYESGTASNPKWSYRDLARASNGLARLFRDSGIRRGDRIGICLPSRPETIAAIIATYKLGCIALSMSPLFGTDAVEYRLRHCGAKLLVAEGKRREIREVASRLENIKGTVVVDGEGLGPKESSYDEVRRASTRLRAVRTGIDEGAHLFYTSGTTGPPKGALHAHRFLLGHVPCFQIYFDMPSKDRDICWTPADWGWIGALGDVVLPSLYFGIPVVASERAGRFDPRASLELMQNYGVTCAFLTPTVLRSIRKFDDHPGRDYSFKLRAVCSAGESVGAGLVEWGKKELRAPINEFYGCTEANLVVVSSSTMKVSRPGAMGRPCPGHIVEVILDDGTAAPPGQVGQIAVKSPDPVMFLGYWGNDEATAAKFVGDWFLTGDLGWKDAEGYVWFKGRMDDVIKTAGYRVGPEEIEDAINRHPSVLESGVVAKPDALRGTIVKAFIVARPGVEHSRRLELEVQNLVKRNLAAYAYPREVEFVDELPRTVTGKLKRFELRKRSGS
jgi:acetyl-CoA synthetase